MPPKRAVPITVEEKEVWRQRRNAARRKRYSQRTDEEVQMQNSQRRQKYAEMTPGQSAIQFAVHAKSQRQRLVQMTPEQLIIHRAVNAECKRRRRSVISAGKHNILNCGHIGILPITVTHKLDLGYKQMDGLAKCRISISKGLEQQHSIQMEDVCAEDEELSVNKVLQPDGSVKSAGGCSPSTTSSRLSQDSNSLEMPSDIQQENMKSLRSSKDFPVPLEEQYSIIAANMCQAQYEEDSSDEYSFNKEQQPRVKLESVNTSDGSRTCSPATTTSGLSQNVGNFEMITVNSIKQEYLEGNSSGHTEVEAEQLRFVKSKNGIELLIHNEYVYRKEGSGGDRTNWHCVDSNKLKCGGRCCTLNGAIIRDGTNTHNHAVQRPTVLVREATSLIKKRPLATSTTPDEEATCRKHNKARAFPPIPASLAQLEIPPRFSYTGNGHRFLQCDSGAEDPRRILIFCTARNLELLARCDHWFAGGVSVTVSPCLFDHGQVYTIHGVWSHKVFPTVFALLPDKTQVSYTRMLQCIKGARSDLSPRSVTTNFEMAEFNAFRELFKKVVCKGYSSHFDQCVWHQIKRHPEIKLAYEDKNGFEFAVHVRMLAALAYVPIGDVIKSFEALMASPFYQEHAKFLKPLTDYFEVTWIGMNNPKRPPLFAHELWNCYNTVVNRLPQVTTSVQVWHRTLAGVLHPTIWMLLDILKSEQGANEMLIEKCITEAKTSQGNFNKQITRRIEAIVGGYANCDVLEYLRKIACNFEPQG